MPNSKFNISYLTEKLLEESGHSSRIESITPIFQGGNNQLFYIKHSTQQFILKKYFQHPDDRRNRLLTEFNFLKIAGKRFPNSVPRVYAKDEESFTALYEYIEGKKIASKDEISPEHIDKAADFIYKINKPDDINLDCLSNASEACFSIDEHVTVIHSRLKELNSELSSNPLLKDTLQKINRSWINVRKKIYLNCQLHKISTGEILNQHKRVISPSDFGFHNAIIKKNSDIVFIDFEYSGWDDPAKLVGDFFNQIAIPINSKFLNQFIESAFKFLPITSEDHIRINILENLYKIKWCCIALNIFLLKNLDRRIFANPNINISELKTTQIAKANVILESLNNELY